MILDMEVWSKIVVLSLILFFYSWSLPVFQLAPPTRCPTLLVFLL